MKMRVYALDGKSTHLKWRSEWNAETYRRTLRMENGPRIDQNIPEDKIKDGGEWRIDNLWTLKITSTRRSKKLLKQSSYDDNQVPLIIS